MFFFGKDKPCAAPRPDRKITAPAAVVRLDLGRQLSQIFDFLPFAAFAVDGEGKIVLWNKALADLTGKKAQNLLNTFDHWKAFYSRPRPSLADAVIRGGADFKSSAAKSRLREEGWFPDINGKDRYLVFEAAPVFGENGAIIAAIETVRDISFEKKIEDSLKASEERFRHVTENADEFIWEVDTESLYTYVNPVCQKILGYSESELIGKKHFYDLFASEVKERMKKTVQAVFARREAIKSLVNPFVGEDGRAIFLETSAVPIIDAAGDFVGYRGVSLDITQRLEMEEGLWMEKASVERGIREKTKQLNDERSRFIAAINSLVAGFFFTDTQQNVLLSNDALKNILGASHAEITLEGIEKKLNFPLRRNYDRCISRKEPIEIKEISLGNKFFRLYLEPVSLFHDGDIIGTAALLEDITEQKNLNQSKNDFIAIASHEMRTPMSIIKGYTEQLQKTLPRDKVAAKTFEMLDSIKRNSDRLLDIVSDFLDSARLEEKAVVFQKELFDINESIARVVTDLSKSAAEKKIYLKIKKPSEKILNVFAPKNHVEQIIKNLLANAIHYTGRGGIVVSAAPEGNFVKFTVADTGVGIALEQQTMLFKKFSTIKGNFMKTNEYGSGLGLYISRLLADGMDGKIQLDKSASGGGSEFSAFFPIAPVKPKD